MAYRVALVADNHFFYTDDGNYYVNGTYTKNYLRRFTSNFDQVTIIARCSKASNEVDISRLRESGGERVSFCKLDDFYGIRAYLKKRRKIKREILNILRDVDAIFVRMPCILTSITFKCAKKLCIPILLDVGADPDSIYRSTRPTLFEICLSKYMKEVCRHQCLAANGVSYVTSSVLQNKYPCKALLHGETKEFFSASISNADIDSFFYCGPRTYEKKTPIRLLHISNNITKNSGKGHFEALQIMKKLGEFGVDANLTFVGGGDDGIQFFKNLAEKLQLSEKVSFTGRIGDREEYLDVIKDHDIFVFPSHSEGLPRVLLEVMATGMLCVASNVDGIPEILGSDDIFDYRDIEGMSNRILELSNNTDLEKTLSRENNDMARRFLSSELKIRYDEFYQKVRILIDQKRGADA